MPFEVDAGPDLLQLRLCGALTRDDLRGVAAAMLELESGLSHIPNRLTDLTQVDAMDVGFPEVLALAQQRRERTFPNHFKSALLVATDVQLGYARMFQTLNDHPYINIEVFTSREAALLWLDHRETPSARQPS